MKDCHLLVKDSTSFLRIPPPCEEFHLLVKDCHLLVKDCYLLVKDSHLPVKECLL